MGSLRSETKILFFRNNYSKLALKNYTKNLQPGFPHSVRTLCSNLKKISDISDHRINNQRNHLKIDN